MIKRRTAALLTLCAAGLALGLWKISRTDLLESSASAMELRDELIAELGPVRPFEARLVGFAYAPVGARVPRRTGFLRDFERKIREAEMRASPDALQTTALLALLDLGGGTKRLPEAIDRLERAVARAPSSAPLWSDLAAVYLASAERGFPWHRARGLAAACRALQLDGALQEARFNFALALQKNFLQTEARKAWDAYLKADPKSGWANEAHEHQRQLGQPPQLALWEQSRPSLDAAALRDDAATVRREVRHFPFRARRYAEDELLPGWAAAFTAGRREEAARSLRIASAIGKALAATWAEHLVEDAVAAIDRASRMPEAAMELAFLARAYEDYAKGVALCESNQGSKGQEPLLRARDVFERLHSPGAAWAIYRLGVCAYQHSEFRQAVTLLEDLLRRPEVARYPSLAGRVYWMIGLSSMVLAEPGLALEAYGSALRALERSGARSEVGGIYDLLAENQLYLGERRRAWRFHYAGLEIAVEEGDIRRRYTALDKTADAVLKERLPEAALLFRDEVVRIALAEPDPPGETHAFLRRAETLFELGRRQEALLDLARSKRACARILDGDERRRREADILLAEGRIRAADEPAAALPFLDRALDLYRTDENRYPIVGAYLARAKALRAAGRPDEAERDLLAGIAEFERQRGQVRDEELRVAYFEQAGELFDLLIDLQAERPGGAEEAFDSAERQRARVLLDRLISGGDRAAGNPGRPLRLPQVKHRLPSVALVAYASLPERLLIWVVRQGAGAPHMVEVPVSARHLTDLVDTLRRDIEQGEPDEVLRPQLSALHGKLLEPVLPYLRQDEPLVFIPDKSLHRVPFAALWNEDTGRHLVEDHASGIAPSASLFVRESTGPSCSSATDGELDLLAVANPRFDGRQFPELGNLDGAEEEASALVALFQGKTQVLQGAGATRDAFAREAGRRAIVHLGTHTILNPDYPHLSRLVLAPTGASDAGLLSAAEIRDLPFPRTRLVYLAACRSGDGTVAAEGVLSLGRAFLAAGVPQVVSSLWNVDDDFSAGFSLGFYGQFKEGEDALDALRHTQLEALKGAGGHSAEIPEWAAFQVSTASRGSC